jgi:hypothetical protein
MAVIQTSEAIFVKNEKCKLGGHLKLKIHIFYQNNTSIIAVRQMKIGTIKDHGQPKSFI